MERKLSVGETLGDAFAIYRDQAGVLIPVAFWLFLGVAVLEGLLEDSIAILAVALLNLAVTFLYQGMVVGLVKDVQDGRRDNSIGDLMRSVLPVLMPLVGAGLLTAAGIVFGSLLLLVPGLYLLTIWAVTAPVIVIEQRGVFDALGRSRQLVRNNGWPVFWTVLVGFLITLVVGVFFAVIATSLSDEALLEIVLFSLASAFTAPFPALVAAVLYFRLREIRDSTASAAEELPPVAS